jgi:hypothetical protein
MHELLEKWNTFGAIYYHNQTWYIRCSAQIWNEVRGDFFTLPSITFFGFMSLGWTNSLICRNVLQISDFEYVGKALLEICAQIPDKISANGV